MTFAHPLRQTQTIDYSQESTTPNRQPSIASNTSSAYTNTSNTFSLGRQSTVSSAASSSYLYGGGGHKRAASEIAVAHPSTIMENHGNYDYSGTNPYKSARQSLRALPQPPAPPKQVSTPQGYIDSRSSYDGTFSSDYPISSETYGTSANYSKHDTTEPVATVYTSVQNPRHSRNHSTSLNPALLVAPDLQSLQKSSTSQLRNLSRLTQGDGHEDFSITSPAQQVTGLHGRRRLQRSDTTAGNQTRKNDHGSEWGGRNWMDKQRQFLQAYEYLCHIGEAKEWIEDIIHRPIPPIIELEETLRDGVTLAEIVQAFEPDRTLRIFRNARLQFKHSDNIALFFRFLGEVELPETFRFELIDLYEKKNIPKVIYCIHALSWLLFRKGIVDFRIGNLVGQLQFEDHELEAMQKGLDRAGVSMPTFGGMGAAFGEEPEPEPQESEEERIDRELGEQEASIADFQSQLRGAMVRLKLGDTMQSLWDAERSIVALQSHIRGDFARQIAQYHGDMRKFAIGIQSSIRGYIVRNRQAGREEFWKRREGDIVLLQSLARASKARAETQSLKYELRRHDHSIREVQAAIRGALRRKILGDQLEETRQNDGAVEGLQAMIRGKLLRMQVAADRSLLLCEANRITKLQAIVRGRLLRDRQARTTRDLQIMNGLWRALQAAARGSIVRDELNDLRSRLRAQKGSVLLVQSASRGARVRQEITADLAELSEHDEIIVDVQSKVRGMLRRSHLDSIRRALISQSGPITKLQAYTRGFLFRQENSRFLTQLHSHSTEITQLQALSRAMLVRAEIGELLARLDAEEDWIIELQAAARGKIVRAQFREKQKFFKENMEKVVKIQSFIRGRLQGEAYKSLTSGTNPPVGTIKNFVHLLNDSDFDFDEEIGESNACVQSILSFVLTFTEFERSRKIVVQHVRQNEMAEQYIDQLDIKIALLVKNKITLDEVVKHQRHFGGHVMTLLGNTEMSSKDPFDLKALNKNSRRKLEHYQQVFFILQTQPQYLSRLFRTVRQKGTAEKDCKKIENLMMGLFGYAQKRREEYYLLKLIARSTKEEIDSSASVQDYLRGNYFWGKLLNSYIRSPRDRKFMRDLLGPLVKEHIIDTPDLDLESDPMQIYRSAINNEELRTGQRSRRPHEVPREEAIRDPETRETFIHHLQDLRDIADQFFTALEDLMPRMPYGIRFIAQQSYHSLCARFPHEQPQLLLQVVGHWVWQRYLQPALVNPENWGVVEKSLSPLQKRNLGEVAKLLGQAAAGRLFSHDNVYLQPLNNYVTEAIERLADIYSNLIGVRDAEAQFDIDEFNDLYARQKPTLYIKMADIFAIHQLVSQDISSVCPNKDDLLRDLVHELGSAKSNENEMSAVSTQEITLTLNPKLHDVEDPEAEQKALFTETKRCILYIIRIQSGRNLLEILVKPITIEDEERWDMLLREEAKDKRRVAYSEATTLQDITSMSYSELKRTALENIVGLEQYGKITRHNSYQDLLNSIAVDIRTKHRRRIQRQRELEGVKLTLANLNEKAVYLDQQLKSYNDYIEQAMVTLQNKKGKKRFLIPFSKQYNHERELARSGRTPKFGSYKYSARALADKGVLVEYKGYNERQYDKINLTISSDAVGVFNIEGSMGSMMMPGASAQIPLDDLLQVSSLLTFDSEIESVKLTLLYRRNSTIISS
jgi:Ras GTPase-activating-like protein IQGAP2/3